MMIAYYKIIYPNFRPFHHPEFILMQKNVVMICILCGISFFVNAQPPTLKVKPHPLADSVANEMCSCIMSMKDSLTTLDLFYAAVNDCLKKNSAPKMDALLKEDGFVQTDDRKTRADAIRMMGLKIGQRVTNNCSGFKTMLDNLTAKENKKSLH